MIKLDAIQTELIKTNLDINGNLQCIKAFRVAELIGVKPKDIASITQEMNIKITNCELGVFGKLKFSQPDNKISNTLQNNLNENKKVECEIAWKLAQEKGTTLKKVASSIRSSNLKVSHCQLGLFYNEEFEDFEKSRK